MKIITVLFCTCIILLGCSSTPKVDIQAEKNTISNLEDQWTVALQTSNVEKILSFHASEAVAMNPNKPITIGLEAIRKGTDSLFADTTLLFNTYSGTVDTIEVSSTGDLAYARDLQEITIKTKNGLFKDKGKWVDIWKKIDGQWKVTVTISNSDLPVVEQ